ncbi:MAG TPA: chorismate synthase, partial [Candidatus Kapabacteria bacterium]|nr:chorismate synthase [Candidatus Kapabacteria bacterium]
MASLRYLTAGESHGEMLVGIIEGMPAGLSLVAERDIDPWLKRRQEGYGRGRRQQIESDTARIVSGVRFGVTTGAPIAILIENKDWANWQQKMSVDPQEGELPRSVTVPRPGHADFAGGIKYGQESDMRNVLERASARETAMRVAIGAVAQTLLKEIGVDSLAYVRSIGRVESKATIEYENIASAQALIDASQVKTLDSQSEQEMIAAIDLAKASKNTLGGTVECVVTGLPVGIGSHVQWDRKLDGSLAQSVMSIQAVKSVQIGLGEKASFEHGSDVHDPFARREQSVTRTRNNAGGLEGGVTNGQPLIIKAAMKPISTLMDPLDSVDLTTGEPTKAHIERSDTCAVPALSIIVQAVVNFTLAQALVDTFGGDTVAELIERVQA